MTVSRSSTKASVAPTSGSACCAADAQPAASTVLTLSLGDTTGWALRTEDGRASSGTRHLRPTRYDADRRFELFRQWLGEIQATAGGIGAVHYQLSRRHVDADARRAYWQYVGTLTEWCGLQRIPCQPNPAGAIKRHVASRGNVCRTTVAVHMRARGHELAGERECEALALLSMVTAARARVPEEIDR